MARTLHVTLVISTSISNSKLSKKNLMTVISCINSYFFEKNNNLASAHCGRKNVVLSMDGRGHFKDRKETVVSFKRYIPLSVIDISIGVQLIQSFHN